MQTRDFPANYGDIKYYRKLHCNKMKAKGDNPVTYAAFINRLKKMNLHDAIEYPRVDNQVRHRMYNRTPIQDNIRRIQVLKDENIQILDLDHLRKLEMKELKTKGKNKVVFCKPKKSLWNRFLDLFRR